MQVFKSEFKDYSAILDIDGWRFASLGCFEKTCIRDNYRVERHLETDEIFQLTSGKAYLIEYHDEQPVIVKMEPEVLYNISGKTWHFIIMLKNAHVLLFEKSNTSPDNSEYYFLDKDQSDEITKKISEF
jgi:hypothetical protein